MNIKAKLIEEFENRIAELNSQINEQELKEIEDLKTAISALTTKISSIRTVQEKGEKIPKDLKISADDITSLNIDTIIKIFPDINAENITNLEHYNRLCRKIFFNPNKEDVLNNLNLICEALLVAIKKKEESHLTINKKRTSIQEILNSLENNYINISKKDLDSIVEILKENGKNELEILEALRELATDVERVILSSSQETITNPSEINRTSEEDEEEILIENEENIEIVKQRIIQILNENGYGNLVPYLAERQNSKVEKIKNDLFTYGKINNIEEIIKIFKKYNINLLEEVENGNLFKIFTLLLYSSKENIEKIFELALNPEICICKYDEQGNLILDEKGKPQINFTRILEKTSRFISRKKRYKRKGNITQDISVDSEVVGNLGDYIKNIRFFQELGVDIKSIFQKIEQSSKDKGNYFDIPHEKILSNKAVFDKYNILPSAYLSRLDCFNACYSADIIDMFIELDIFEYIQSKVARLNLHPKDPIVYRIVRTYQLAETLPNPNNLSLHQNAKQFLFKNWHGDLSGKYTGELLDGYIANPEYFLKRNLKPKLDTKIGSKNGYRITCEYRREQVLTEEQLYNFKCFDDAVNNDDNISLDFIDESSLLIRKINAISKIIANYNNGTPNVLIFGKEPNEFRISKMKFFRIYNTLCKNGFNIDNDKDCVLYALTYNSILTKEQFELVKTIVDKELFKEIPMSRGKIGGGK